jgi:hypothetical protein
MESETNEGYKLAKNAFGRHEPSHQAIESSPYEDVSKSFRTRRLERELQMLQLSATRCSCIAILWVSLVSFATITLRVPSLRVFIVIVVYSVTDSVQKLLDTPSYAHILLV